MTAVLGPDWLAAHLARERPQAIPERVRREVLERDSWQCVACGVGGDNRLQLHHLVYRSQGGTHAQENLATVCFNCHEDVHAGLLEIAYLEWYPGMFGFFCRRRVAPARWRNTRSTI